MKCFIRRHSVSASGVIWEAKKIKIVLTCNVLVGAEPSGTKGLHKQCVDCTSDARTFAGAG